MGLICTRMSIFPSISSEERCRFCVSLLVGLMSMMASGIPFAISPLKQELTRHDGLNLTQFGANSVIWSGIIGWAFCLPAGYLSMVISSLWLCVISCIGSTVSYLLLWSAVRAVQFYSGKTALVCVYAFFGGHSISYLYQAALTVNLRNATRENVGKVIGLLHVPLVGFPLFLERIFVWADLKDVVSGAIFLVQLGVIVSASFVAILGLRARPKDSLDIRRQTTTADIRDLTTRAYEYPSSDTESFGSMEDDDQAPIVPSNQNVLQSLDPIHSSYSSLVSLNIPDFISFRFHQLLWTFVFASASGFSILWSLNDPLSLTELTVFTFCTCIARGLSGHISDRTRNSLSRGNYVFVSLLMQFFAGLFVVFYIQNRNAYVIFIGISGVVYGLEWCLIPSILREKFGLRRFGVFWAVILLIFVLFAIICHVISFSFFPLICSGIQCNQLIVMLHIAFTFCAIVWTCGLID